mgnify:CR=1 FL=1
MTCRGVAVSLVSLGTVILFSSATALSQSPGGADPAQADMEAEVRQLLETIAGLSGYAMPEALPEIFVMPQHALESKLCDLPCNATAAYFPREGIYLAGHLVPLRAVADRAALVHELVHFLQQGHAKFKKLAGCEREIAKEREAFEIQNAYLTTMGSRERVQFFEGVYECKDE